MNRYSVVVHKINPTKVEYASFNISTCSLPLIHYF